MQNGTIHIVYMYVYIFQQKYEQNMNNHTKKEDFSYILHFVPKKAPVSSGKRGRPLAELPGGGEGGMLQHNIKCKPLDDTGTLVL